MRAIHQSVGDYKKFDGLLHSLTPEIAPPNDNTLLDSAGMPHSESLHVVERLRLDGDGEVIVNRITIEDPDTFTRP